ncbi:MAG: hypothetical protein J6V13_06100 [Paludibacteraceae bacterium]|nr:hypothetical protein [Paludibacteraceae bacterium]
MSRFIFLLSFIFATIALLAENVTNVYVWQEGTEIIITYDLDKEADITLSYTVQGRTMPEPYSVYGDVGTNIAPGSKEIVWKVLEDFESFEYEDVVFYVNATKSTKRKLREPKKYYIDPWGGADFGIGIAGDKAFGAFVTGYIPLGVNRLSLVTNLRLTYPAPNAPEADMLIACNVGLSVMLRPGICVSVAPGVGVAKELDPYNYDYSWGACFSIDMGVGLLMNVVSLTMHLAYPIFFGLGLGFGM